MNIYQFNKLYGSPASKALLRKAMLSSATDVGSGLIPEKLVDVITNTAVRLVPELSVPVLRFDNQKYHSFNRLTSIPSAGSAMGETSTTPLKRSTYKRDQTLLSVMKRKGAVTGFLEAAAKKYINPNVAEMESHIQSFGNDLRTYMLFGNQGADAYAFNGLDYYTSTNRTNLIGNDQVQTDLSLLDSVIDKNTRLQGAMHRKCLLMSPELLSVLSRHWTAVRDVRNIPGTHDIEVPGGYRLESYRHVPILETSATRPLTQMGTVTLGVTGSGSCSGTYYIRVSAVTWDGEQGASASNNSIDPSSQKVTCAFAAVANAIFYKVYASTTKDAETLIAVVSAFTYDGDGTPTETTTGATFTITLSTMAVDTASVTTAMSADIPLEYSTGDNAQPTEYMFLWDLDEFQGMGKVAYTNEGGSAFGGLITPMEVYNTDDNYPFLLKSYSALIDAFEAPCAVVRGIRTK